MTRSTLAAVAATAILSSATGAFVVSLTAPTSADAGTGDTRIVRELRAVNRNLEAIDEAIGEQLGYSSLSFGPKSVHDSLKEICANGRQFASTC